MARKKLLTEGEIRQFMKLANLRPIGEERLSEMGGGYMAGARDDDEEDEDTSMFGQAVGTIESPEAGEEFPEEVAQQLESEVPEQGSSLLGEQ